MIESVFAWPGVGLLMWNSILTRDYPVVMGILIVISLAVILSNLITDVVYAYLDPRVRYR